MMPVIPQYVITGSRPGIPPARWASWQPRHAHLLTLAFTPLPAKATPDTAGIVGITDTAGERLIGSYPYYLDLTSTAIVTDVGYKVFRS